MSGGECAPHHLHQQDQRHRQQHAFHPDAGGFAVDAAARVDQVKRVQQVAAVTKEKILSRNAARIYGIDLEQAARTAANDDLAWARQLLADFKKSGFAALR